jgi:hypothetical protein
MKFIKYVDFFTIKFNFYINNQPNYQNIFGGIMTSFYILISILIFFVFSYDDLNKLNPITTISELPDVERKSVNMKNSKIWIPFRMVNYENKFIDHRDFLYIVPYFIEGKFIDQQGMNLTYHLLKYKLCNETTMINSPFNYRIDIPLNQLFCIDEDNILFGGNWDNSFLNYIELNLYLCKEGIAYNSSDPRCSKLDNYLKTLNSSLLIDFYFPIVEFEPTNLETPIKIIYKNYFYRLTSFSYKIQKLYIREHILYDDRNIIGSNGKNSSYWGMSSLYSDDYFLPSEFDPISNNSNTSRIFALNIYMDNGLTHYTRSFKKIFIIISDVSPWLRIVLYFVNKFTKHIKMSFTKRRLTSLIFENRKKFPKRIYYKKFNVLTKNINNVKNIGTLSNKSEQELIRDKSIKDNDLNLKDANNINININRLNQDNFNQDENDVDNNQNITIYRNKKKDLYNNVIFKRNILSKKINNPLSDDDINNNFNVKQMSLTNSRNKTKSLFDLLEKKDSYKMNNTSSNRKQYKYIFPYYYFCFDFIFDKVIYPKKFCCIPKNYFIIYNFMCRIYDISTHIILFKHFYLLNNTLKEKLTEDNIYCQSNLKRKINISDNNLVERLNREIKNKTSIFYGNSLK